MLEMSRLGDINGNIYSVRNPPGKYLSVPRGWVKGVGERSRRKIIRKNGEKKLDPLELTKIYTLIHTHAIV